MQATFWVIKTSIDIEVSNRHGHTCLMIACYKGHYRIAQYLLTLGANVNRKSVKGNTALHDCAESGSLDILKLLIQQGAKMDVDSYGKSPGLTLSSLYKVKTVLKCGASMEGNTVFHACCLQLNLRLESQPYNLKINNFPQENVVYFYRSSLNQLLLFQGNFIKFNI